MVSRGCGYLGVAGLLTLQIAMAAWAEDVPVHGPVAGLFPAVAGPQDWTRQAGGLAGPQFVPDAGPTAAAPDAVQPPLGQWSSAVGVSRPQPGTWPSQAIPSSGWAVSEQVPPRRPTMDAIPPTLAGPAPAPRLAVDSRWAASGFVPGDPQMPPGPIVGSVPPQDRRAVQRAVLVGVVHGRLSNKGRPLVNCQVVIVPLHEQNGVSAFDPDRKPLATVTDEQGEYHFDDVPPGSYKLTWLPQGQRRWIRRIAMSPDVKVHPGEVTRLRDIRVALQTVN